jgi:hypothetical protein
MRRSDIDGKHGICYSTADDRSILAFIRSSLPSKGAVILRVSVASLSKEQLGIIALSGILNVIAQASVVPV